VRLLRLLIPLSDQLHTALIDQQCGRAISAFMGCHKRERY
jgi:hypothetical protein